MLNDPSGADPYQNGTAGVSSATTATSGGTAEGGWSKAENGAYNVWGNGSGGGSNGSRDGGVASWFEGSEQKDNSHVYKINKKTGKAEIVDVESIKDLLPKSSKKLLEKGGDFIFRDGRLSITSSKTIAEINDSSKADLINKFAIEKLQSDAVKYNGNFPENYNVDFSKAVIEHGIKLYGPDKGFEAVNEHYGVENLPDAKSVLQLYESIVPTNDATHFDKVQHFIASAFAQYDKGGVYTDAVQYGKEIFKDEIPSWFGDDIGFDPNDMKANNQGQAFGKKLFEKYHPIRNLLRNLN